MNDRNLWSLAWQLVEIGLLFGLVLVLAYLTTRFLARRMTPHSVGRSFRMLDQLPLGPNRALFLVEVGGRALVVGATEQALSVLTTFEDPQAVQAFSGLVESGEETAESGDWRGWFSGWWQSSRFGRRLEEALRKTHRLAQEEPYLSVPGSIHNSLHRLKRLHGERSRDEAQ
ncbi:MAG: flagellar biosynthetic protein FliO [Firmicutes bacterium]|nr:flagellar biosynthetic protein FliO [Bacillota bacterium]